MVVCEELSKTHATCFSRCRMKRWLPRSLWLLAWSFWAWLGWGLYRELPRKPGVPLCTLPTTVASAYSLGFVDDDHVAHYSQMKSPSGHDATTITVFDARTGQAIRKADGPARNSFLGVNFFTQQCRKGVLFAKVSAYVAVEQPPKGIFLLDLKTMKWRRVSNRTTVNLFIHPTRPWVVFNERSNPQGLGAEVVVLNYESGEETVLCKLPPDLQPDSQPFFANDTRVVVTMERWKYGSTQSDFKRVEIWRIDEKPKLEKRIDGLPSGAFHYNSNNGRVAFYDPDGSKFLDVYDVISEQYLFSHPPRETRPAVAAGPRQSFPFMSFDGSKVFGGDPAALWDIDANTPVWWPSWFEDGWMQNSQSVFMVRENWDTLWALALPSLKLKTYAYRNFDDGRMLMRTWTSNLPLGLRNPAGTLAIASGGVVNHLPYPVDWPLLFFCQFILALPLILLWAALRWRCNRKLRLASVRP